MRTTSCKHNLSKMAGMKLKVRMNEAADLKPSGIDLEVIVYDLSKESKKLLEHRF